MVKLVNSQQLKELETELKAKMVAQGLAPENLRLTLVGLPVSLDPKTGKLAADPKKLSKDLVNRAQRHRAEQTMRGVELQYGLGFNPSNGKFSLAHITKVQMKAAKGNSAEQTLENFMTFVNDVAPSLPEMVKTSIAAKGTFVVKAGNESYKPVKNHKTVWADDNVDKGPLAAILKIMGQSLSKLGLLHLVVNGLGAEGENSRPHFTNEREEDEAAALALLKENIDAEVNNEEFGLLPVISISDESGELHDDGILLVCLNGEWVKPEQARHVLLSREEAPMPSYYSTAFKITKPMLTSLGIFIAGCTATLFAQAAAEVISSYAAPRPEL